MGTRVRKSYVAWLVCAVALGSSVPAQAAATAGPQSVQLSPGLFNKVSTGVAYVTTYSCGGRLTGKGSGFLIGRSVVMTARHVVRRRVPGPGEGRR